MEEISTESKETHGKWTNTEPNGYTMLKLKDLERERANMLKTKMQRTKLSRT